MEDFEAKYKKRIETLSDTEKGRKEQHGATRIIYNREISPVQMYQNVIDNTSFVFKNRAMEEGKKIIHKLKGIRGRRNLGIAIQCAGVIMVLISLYIMNGSKFDVKGWSETSKTIFIVSFFLELFIFPFVGGIIRSSGRKYYSDYITSYPGPAEINRLQNGQLVVIKYMHRDYSLSEYQSALNLDDTQHIKGSTVWIPTYVVYMYIIDSVKSCTRTKKGLMIESSGRYYGERTAWEARTGSRDTNAIPIANNYCVYAETQVLYRKEEILDIFTNMNQLEAEFMNYKDYQVGQDAFVPYGSGINIQGQER